MSTRRKFIQQGTAAAATAAMMGTKVFGEAPAAAAGARPNIILILADDMGFSDIGCFGSEIQTPNLDRLAAMGMRSSQWYNNPRCCPSRASIMTGLYPHQAGMGMMVGDGERYPYPEYAGDLSPHTCTIPEVLKSVGYQTAMIGKWHLTAADPKGDKHNWPLQRGFDKYWGMIAGASVYYHPKVLIDGNTPLPEVTDPNFYLTDAWTDHAVKFVNEMSKNKAPYFLYTAYNACHWPIQAPEEVIAKYEKRYKDGWDKLREERHAKQLKMGLLDSKWTMTARDPRVPAWPEAADKDWEMRRMAVYAAMIDKLDQGVGRIMKAVEDAGQMDNTLFVFMADNGGNSEEMGPGGGKGPSGGGPEMKRGNDPAVMPGPGDTFQSIGIPWGNCANTPFRLYKHYAHEGGISSPFIACWPKVIKPNVIEAALGHETDLMPTFLELAGASYPKSNAKGPIPAMVGESMMPVFEGKGRERGPIFWEHEGNKAVRDGKWKLVSRFPDGWELYDMEADRTELHDLAHKEKDRVKKMEGMWNDWAKMVGARTWPMPGTPKNEREGAMPTPDYLKKRA
jgi:arylsulfatase A-like enzyme